MVDPGKETIKIHQGNYVACKKVIYRSALSSRYSNPVSYVPSSNE